MNFHTTHKKRGGELTYCHQAIETVLEKGHNVKLQWPGVTCKKCRSFLKFKNPKNAVETDFWKKLREKEISKEREIKIKTALAKIVVHGAHFSGHHKTFCGEEITVKLRVMKFPRITCESCKKVRRHILPQKGRAPDYDIELDEKRLRRLFKEKGVKDGSDSSSEKSAE